MRRRGEHGARRPALDGAAGIHHGDLVAQLCGKPQVVGDEDDRGAVGALHVGDQRQDRRMHGDVERGGRLVGDDQARIGRKRQSDQHALAHAAGQLMRILRQQFAGARQSRRRQHGDRAVAARAAAVFAEPRQMLVELRADGAHRIERGHRRLRDEGDGAAEQRAPRAWRHAQKVFAFEQQRPGRDRKTGRQQLRDGAADHGFAGAGFADEPEDFSRRQIERQRTDRRHHRAVDAGADHEIFGLQRQHGHRPVSASRTSSVRRSPSPRRLNAVTVRKIAKIGSSKFHGD